MTRTTLITKQTLSVDRKLDASLVRETVRRDSPNGSVYLLQHTADSHQHQISLQSYQARKPSLLVNIVMNLGDPQGVFLNLHQLPHTHKGPCMLQHA